MCHHAQNESLITSRHNGVLPFTGGTNPHRQENGRRRGGDRSEKARSSTQSSSIRGNQNPVFVTLRDVSQYVRLPLLTRPFVYHKKELSILNLPDIWVTGTLVVLRSSPGTVAIVLRRERGWLSSKTITVLLRGKEPDDTVPEMVVAGHALGRRAVRVVTHSVIAANRGGELVRGMGSPKPSQGRAQRAPQKRKI